MALPVIIAKNQTASPVTLTDVGVIVPASGQVTLTDALFVYEILNSKSVHAAITAAEITLNVEGVDLNGAQSAVYVNPAAPSIEILHNLSATTNPTVSDGELLGYSRGSFWMNTSTNVLWSCYAATAGAAVWSTIGVNGVDPAAHAPRHLPSGADPLTTATAISITDSTNGIGTANSLARSDHSHAHGDRGGGSLHALVTTSVDGFMAATDKIKLDSLGQAVASSVITSSTASTTSSTFQDGFPSQNITLTVPGDYLVLFDTNVSSSTASGVPEIGIALNGTVQANSQRFVQGNGGASVSGFTHTILIGLIIGDVLTGMFRKSSGSGTTSIANRRLTALLVNR
jgi:hypothetical protein